MLKYSAAALGGVLGYKGLQMAGLTPAFGSGPGAVNANKLGQAHAELGNWVYLTPQKLGGGSMAVDMGTGKCMAWISYWNYGDTCPISHHLAAYPSPRANASNSTLIVAGGLIRTSEQPYDSPAFRPPRRKAWLLRHESARSRSTSARSRTPGWWAGRGTCSWTSSSWRSAA